MTEDENHQEKNLDYIVHHPNHQHVHHHHVHQHHDIMTDNKNQESINQKETGMKIQVDHQQDMKDIEKTQDNHNHQKAGIENQEEDIIHHEHHHDIMKDLKENRQDGPKLTVQSM